jgi:predicted RNA-binding Zn-ribbon protein involved in translation (DUF1610 family)
VNAKTRGYTLTFRCINCGRSEAATFYPSTETLPIESLRKRIYEVSCSACGWRGAVCGMSAVAISYKPES